MTMYLLLNIIAVKYDDSIRMVHSYIPLESMEIIAVNFIGPEDWPINREQHLVVADTSNHRIVILDLEDEKKTADLDDN